MEQNWKHFKVTSHDNNVMMAFEIKKKNIIFHAFYSDHHHHQSSLYNRNGSFQQREK